MQYSVLGRTGLQVSRLGFGAMRLPMSGDRVDRDLAIPMIHRAFEAGVNYIDTASMYCRNDSQVVVGEALKGWRNRIVVSTKNGYYGEDEKEWWQNLENSLQRLQVDRIDVYNTHGLNKEHLDRDLKPRVIRWLTKARDQGLVRHVCTSFHDTNETLREIVDTGFFESITLPYNLLNRRLEDGMAYARQKNVGVAVMGPVGGGRLAAPTDVLAKLAPNIRRIPELALRFVWSNPNVNIALSGMSTMEQVEENLALAETAQPLTPDELRIVREQLDRLQNASGPLCTACGYCQPCPMGVRIPAVFGLYDDARVYGLWDASRDRYAEWGKRILARPKGDKRADGCTECGVCEEKCPPKIPIRERLKEAHAALSGTPP